LSGRRGSAYHRAEKLEQRIWRFVSDLMQNPECLRKDLEGTIELEREVSRGDPDRETKAWLEKITEVDQERRGWLRIAAKGGPTARPTKNSLRRWQSLRKRAGLPSASLRPSVVGGSA
jgi:hypothetical protein